jgi:lipid-A-disaccharide synthase
MVMLAGGEAKGMRPLRVALVAAETSGDALGAGLIEAIREVEPDAEFFGVAGARMIEAGCECWYRAEDISSVGFIEVLKHLPALYVMRRDLVARIKARRPDVLIGIDAPAFNVPVEAMLKKVGVATVQYVSPQVWAWRQSRVTTIRAATDLVLCVLPFEKAFYDEHGVSSRFIGHPLADAVPLAVDAAEARARLGLPAEGTLVAILPGSRKTEASRLGPPFMETARWLQRRRPDVRFAVALANDNIGEVFRKATAGVELSPAPALITGKARDVMAASDLVLTASGTATLEAALLKRPMVVAYRISPLSYLLAHSMGITRLAHFSLPNLLARRTLVPEFKQEQVRAEVLGPALLDWLEGRPLDPDWHEMFTSIHEQLRCGASAQAARAVLDLVAAKRPAAHSG